MSAARRYFREAAGTASTYVNFMARPAKFDDQGILDAAGAIVASRGVAAATISAIGSSIGAPNGSIYHRFKTRDELLGRLWLQKARAYQDAFVEGLSHRDAYRAGLDAALSLPASVRRDLAGARILLLYRREDFVGGGWPAEMSSEATRLARQIRDALDDITRRLFGRLTPSARTTASFAVLQVPYAAVRQHVVANESPPSLVDELIATAYEAVIARRRAEASDPGTTSGKERNPRRNRRV